MTRTATRRQVAQQGLERVVPFQRAAPEPAGEDDGLSLDGHAAVFNQLTLIDGWEGRFYEQCAPGCFARTFRRLTPVLQFDHGRHPTVGSIPIGAVSTVEEDDVGAHVEARLHDNWLVQPVRDAIASGSINGMSFRFTVVREEWHDEDGRLVKPEAIADLLWSSRQTLTRTLLELQVPELGPVVFPAYPTTDIAVRKGGRATPVRQPTAPARDADLTAHLAWMDDQIARGRAHQRANWMR